MTGVYLLGFALIVAGVLLGLYKAGILGQLDTTWVVVAVLVVVGLGIVLGATRRPPTVIQ
jgi:hypothetical protein